MLSAFQYASSCQKKKICKKIFVPAPTPHFDLFFENNKKIRNLKNNFWPKNLVFRKICTNNGQ